MIEERLVRVWFQIMDLSTNIAVQLMLINAVRS